MGAAVIGHRVRTRRRRRDRGDRGALLPLTALLVTVLSFVMVSLATYATVGVKTSRSATAVQRATAGAKRGLDLALYQYGHDVWVPCTAVEAISVPSAITVDLDGLTMNCAPAGSLSGHPLVTVASQARSGSATVTFLAVIQVSVDGTGASLLSVQRI